MKLATKIRSGVIRDGLTIAGLLIGGGAGLCAQVSQNMPAKPSAAVSTLPLPAAQPTAGKENAGTAAPAVASHVNVEYADGKLAVQATNASLNEILREVGQKTGMKITGGVADDKVFGSYGPSATSVVLDALLEGTGSNMLLVDDAKGGSELILTPRHGGVTPPNPNAAQARESEDNGGGGYVPPVRAYQPPGQNGRGPGGAPPDSQVNAPGSGDGNKTPQEIYDQLQQTMQQQRHLGTTPQQQ